MRVKGTKAWRSTADKLKDHREALEKYYSTVRNPKMKQIVRPPRESFPMNIQHLVERIESEELKRHESLIEQAKQWNKPS